MKKQKVTGTKEVKVGKVSGTKDIYEYKRIKLLKFYIWFNKYGVNCWGFGNWSGSKFIYNLKRIHISKLFTKN